MLTRNAIMGQLSNNWMSIWSKQRYKKIITETPNLFVVKKIEDMKGQDEMSGKMQR